jgi:hypothetical protein
VLRVHEDDLVVLVGRVLVDPVGVQDTQVGAAASNTLLGSGSERSLILQLVNTLVGGLAYRSQRISLNMSISPTALGRRSTTERSPYRR